MVVRTPIFAEMHKWLDAGHGYSCDYWNRGVIHCGCFGVTAARPERVVYRGDLVSHEAYPSRWTGGYGWNRWRRLRGRAAKRQGTPMWYIDEQWWIPVSEQELRETVESIFPHATTAIVPRVYPYCKNPNMRTYDAWEDRVDSLMKHKKAQFLKSAGKICVSESTIQQEW